MTSMTHYVIADREFKSRELAQRQKAM